MTSIVFKVITEEEVAAVFDELGGYSAFVRSFGFAHYAQKLEELILSRIPSLREGVPETMSEVQDRLKELTHSISSGYAGLLQDRSSFKTRMEGDSLTSAYLQGLKDGSEMVSTCLLATADALEGMARSAETLEDMARTPIQEPTGAFTDVAYEERASVTEDALRQETAVVPMDGIPDDQKTQVWWSSAMTRVGAERQKQVSKGLDLSYDLSENLRGELADVAVALLGGGKEFWPLSWPEAVYDKYRKLPRVECLTVAASLLMAEIDRLTAQADGAQVISSHASE